MQTGRLFTRGAAHGQHGAVTKREGTSMQDLNGKVAFITGGASGIGLSMAEAFGREGMAVMLADIEEAALDRAVADLRERQISAAGVVADVTSRAAVQAAAEAAVIAFGKVPV